MNFAHLKRVLPHPRGEIRLISPHEKKKKILLRQKRSACPETKRNAIHARHFKVRKTPWGSFAHLGSFPKIKQVRRDLRDKNPSES
jgi:hypothetical protein